MDSQALLNLAIDASLKACSEIIDVYNSGYFQAEAKGDNSPLTQADKRAHHVINQALTSTGFPVLSEEGRSIPFEERKNWPYFWMVDPLDGTKEFIKRNGEFTVNIALIHEHKPVLGVVAVPVNGDVYYAIQGEGAYLRRNGKDIKLSKRAAIDLKTAGLRVVGSRSHMSKETEEFIGKLTDATLVAAGSSLKFLIMAEGKADIYPRFGPTMEWDTAAAHIIVQETGMDVRQLGSDVPLVYNKENLLNPYFIVS